MVDNGQLPTNPGQHASRRLPLNAFLLRPSVQPLDAFGADAREEATWFLWEHDHLQELLIDRNLFHASVSGDVMVAVTDRPSGVPAWQLFFKDSLGMPEFGDAGRALGSAIFCAIEDPLDSDLRWIVYTFGFASRAIQRRSVEPRFGLLVALNRISESQTVAGDARRQGLLRQASYRVRGPVSSQAGYRAARDTSLESFRIDRLADLLSAAGGRVGPDENPDQVFGSRSLRTRDEVGSINDLLRLGGYSLRDFRSHGYRANFSFVDQMVPVHDNNLEDRLRAQLYADIVSGCDDFDVLLPDDLVPYEDERSICYIVRPGEREASAYDMALTVDMVEVMIRDSGVHGLDQMLRFSDTDRKVIARASILDCLAAEFEFDSARYVIYDGDFYSVDAALIARIDGAVSDIATIDLDFPCYRGGSEATWSESVAKANPQRFILLDGNLIRLPGQTAFEACDLLDTEGRLIHAKRKSRSSSMSHLFVQAEQSTQMLLGDADARSQLCTAIRNSAKKASVHPGAALDIVKSLENRNHDVSIVLALLGDWHERGLTNLPLLAKMALVGSVASLKQLVSDTSVALVQLCSRQ